MSVQSLVDMTKTEENTLLVLKENLYKEATSDKSIRMVVSYCKGRGIDPLLKAVHIVPMWNKNTQSMEDTIMPGIGLYRIIAARSGNYAGMSEPVYGEDVTEKLGSVSITYPKWCMVIVRKIIQGQIVDFPAKEYWKENYAQFKKADITPNSMWQKRPYGQLAKCAEAQALRKAFPEVGHDYTYEELDGKTFNVEPENKKPYMMIEHKEPEKTENKDVEFDQEEFDELIYNMSICKTEDDLKEQFTIAWRNQMIKSNVMAKNKLVSIKDKFLESIKKTSLDSEMEEILGECEA